jgi:erythromycin esterase-like protein
MTAEEIRRLARPMGRSVADLDPLLAAIGDARVVLLGEASHGSDEFYRERARITRRLITERGFRAVAVEADWPAAYRVNRYVRGGGPPDASPVEALAGFERFPAWMWRNTAVLDFVGWLRSHNDRIADPATRVGFYGLDLYSLHASIEAVLSYLGTVDPVAAVRARQRYACFDHFGGDADAYGYAATFGLDGSCEEAVVAQLLELRARKAEYARRDGRVAADDLFYAEQNARLVQNAEAYYRAMFRGGVASWNLRDRHMAETLDALLGHLGDGARIVVWAHNSHVGDARATELGDQGELNLGQLARARHGSGAVLVGFTTYAGTVTAASDWGGPAERKHVRPALPGSWEALFHATTLPAFLLVLRDRPGAMTGDPARLERAIGVIYRPETERRSHYFHARLAEQFDAVIHIDWTQAVEPLERSAGWEAGEVPETFPSAL